MKRPITLVLHAWILLAGLLRAQSYVDLDFTNNVQPNNAIYPNNSTLGPDYYNGAVFDFTNVGTTGSTTIDARMSLVSTSGKYELVGWIPDYNQDPGQPEGDLGVYGRSTDVNGRFSGGLVWRMDFFEGGGSFTTPLTLPAFRFLIYDHDGEAQQRESLRVFLDDGFIGYQIRDDSGITAVDEGASWLFPSRGLNHSETNEDGGMILYFANTNHVLFQWDIENFGGLPPQNSGFFKAIDGDLSLTGGSTANFSTFAPVPEPSTSTLAILSILRLLRRQRN
jgi:hypothetical protein